MNKVIEFQNRIISDTFMPRLEHSSIRTEILASILETYTFRIRIKYSQEKWAKLHNVSLATLKRIESGKCYDLILINKYSK